MACYRDSFTFQSLSHDLTTVRRPAARVKLAALSAVKRRRKKKVTVQVFDNRCRKNIRKFSDNSETFILMFLNILYEINLEVHMR
jgi:hypothetical protein